MSVAVVRGSRDTLVFRGYGYANVEHDVPATAQTVYRIGSLTKQFTAAAVMKLVEEGCLTLDATLGSVLTDIPIAWQVVTVRQLLNHSGGIPEMTEHPGWPRLERVDAAPDSLLAIVRADSLEFRPGTRVAYSNTGYVLLGMIIEKVSGQRYRDYLTARLLRPLGLVATSYCDERAIVKRRAQGYARAGDTIINAPFVSMTRPFAAGALCSTAGDLAAWHRALATGRVLSAASFARMTTPEGSAATVRYGYGLWARHFEGRLALTHDGAIAGFRAVSGYVPDDSLSVTVLGNGEVSSAGLARLHRMIMRIGLGLPPTPPVVTLTATERARYVGRYEGRAPNGESVTWMVSEEGGSLVVEQGPIRTRLVPYGAHTFGSSANDTFRLRFTVERNRATALEIVLPEMQLRGQRVP